MKNELFRKKSIERISSPEQLDDYIRVSNPGVWIILLAVIILLVGLCVWGVYGTMDSVVIASTVSDGRDAVCYILDEDLVYCTEGMTVYVGDVVGKLGKIDSEDLKVADSFSEEMIKAGNLTGNETVRAADVKITLPVGVYCAEILVESVSPLSFVFN